MTGTALPLHQRST